MPESVPLAAWASPHMGSRPAVDQLLSGFVQCRAQLLAGQRIYDLPVTGRIGSPAPSAIQNGRGPSHK